MAALLGVLAGAVSGVMAVLTVQVWASADTLGSLSWSQNAILIGVFVLWGALLPRHFKVLFAPLVVLIGSSDVSSGVGGSVSQFLLGTVMTVGAVLLAVGLFLNRIPLGQTGSVLFWLPFVCHWLFGRRPAKRA